MKTDLTIKGTIALAVAALTLLSAPALTQAATLLSEDFETWPPAGWTIVDNSGEGGLWLSSETTTRANNTGGSGYCADADSDAYGSAMETSLITPTIDLVGKISPTLEFKSDFNDYGNQDDGFVEVTTNGGTSWHAILHYDKVDVRGPLTTNLPLDAFLGESNVQIRFRYVATGYDWWWEVDDVTVYEEVPNVALEPIEQSGEGFPGNSVSYSLKIINDTGATDSFALGYVSSPWAETGPANSGELADGASTSVTISVQIPADAMAGQMSTTAVTAVGVADNSFTGTATIITLCTWQQTVFCEHFTDELPDGWTNYRLGEALSGWEWQSWGGNPDGTLVHMSGNSILSNWYVSPPVDIPVGLDTVNLSFDEKQYLYAQYHYAGVWVSMGAREPSGGDYTELFQIPKAPDYVYRTYSLDFSAYEGMSNVYIALVYICTNAAQKQYIDNLCLGGEKTGIDNAVLASPPTIAMDSYQTSPTITGKLFINGQTGVSGPAANVTAQIGLGLRNSTPDDSWCWTTASYTGPDGTDDVFAGDMFVTVSGDQDYAYRFRRGEAAWVYADLDGSTNGYSSDAAGKMSISNCPLEGDLLLDQAIPSALVAAYASSFQAPSNAPPAYQQSSDDFSFPYDAAVRSVRWGGLYYGDGRQCLEYGFWLRIYDNAVTATTNHPGNLLYAEYKSGYACEQWFTNDPAYDIDIFTYDVTLATPFAAVGGSTYWFSIQDEVTSDTFWSWLDNSATVQGNPAFLTHNNFFGTDTVVWTTIGCNLGYKLYGDKAANVYLDPEAQSAVGHPDDVVLYPLTVKNQTDVTNTYALSYDGPWPASGPADSGVMLPGATKGIIVDVTVPGSALEGQIVTTVVTAIGITDPAYTNSAVVVTECTWIHKLWCENFDVWPPAGWSFYEMGAANAGWTNASPGADGTGQCAYHNDNAVDCDDWLVTPPVDLATSGFDAVKLTFENKIGWASYYCTSVVMISTGSMNPADGDYVPLLDVGNTDTVWTKREINLAAYVGSNPVYFAFRYVGNNDHEWSVDDVCVVGVQAPVSGTLDGYVRAAHSGLPIEGASVSIDAGAFLLITDSNGYYSQSLPTSTYVVAAAAANYASQTVTGVEVTEGATTHQNFDLVGSLLGYTPSDIAETMNLGDVVTNAVIVTNSGPFDVNYTMSVSGGAFTTVVAKTTAMAPVPRISLPPSDGKFPRGSGPLALFGPPGESVNDIASASLAGLAMQADVDCYGVDINNDASVSWNTATPGTLTTIGATTDDIYGGDFLGADFNKLYAVTAGGNLVTVDTSDGSIVVVGALNQQAGDTMVGVSQDPTDGTLYASGTDLTTSRLYTINPATGASTLIGAVNNADFLLAIGVNSAGEMYGLDGVGDNLVSINKATGAGTVVGLLGYDANYVQGMDFSAKDDTLWIAAYNYGVGLPQLRIGDTDTGNTTEVGTLGDGSGDISTIAIAAQAEPKWARTSTNAGTVAAGTVSMFDVIFDANLVSNLGTYTAEMSFSGNFVNDVPPMPLTMIIGPYPMISVDPLSVDFGDVYFDSVTQALISVASIGTAELDVYVYVTNCTPVSGWLSGDWAHAVIPTGGVDYLEITADMTGLGEGVYTCDVLFASNDPQNPEVYVPVTIEVIPEPMLAALAMACALGIAAMRRRT